MEDSDKVTIYRCYWCGKDNPGVFFCNEECHRLWAEAHYPPLKKKLTIPEIQARLREMAAKAREENRLYWEQTNKDNSDNLYEVAKLIFNS